MRFDINDVGCTLCVYNSVNELRVLSEEELVERALREAMEMTSLLLTHQLLCLCYEPAIDILM